MHKKIVEQIEQIINNSQAKEKVEVFVKRQETGGFWAMLIVAEEGGEYFLPHLESTGLCIGRLHGEMLEHRFLTKNILRLS